MNRIAIRREEQTRWKRCVPLVPDDAVALVAEGVPLAIQPSSARVFCEAAYETAGVAVREAIDGADLIMGVGRPSAKSIDAPRAWMFFSNAADEHPESMPMLQKLLDTGGTLLDYDLIVNDEGQQLVFFDRDAAHAVDVDMLPAEFSIDASRHFSEALRSFVPTLARTDFEAPSVEKSGLPRLLQRACIAWRGQLTPPYERLEVSLTEYGSKA